MPSISSGKRVDAALGDGGLDQATGLLNLSQTIVVGVTLGAAKVFLE